MVRNSDMEKVFPSPPMVAYRQPPNLKKTLVRTALPPEKTRGPNNLIGTKKCKQKQCKMCKYFTNTERVISNTTGESFLNKNQFTCQTKGVIYLITCNKTDCGKQYVGESLRTSITRFGEHLYYVKSSIEATGKHFNSNGHTHENMEVQIIEKVYPNNKEFRLERESYWINKLKTKSPGGLNKNN